LADSLQPFPPLFQCSRFAQQFLTATLQFAQFFTGGTGDTRLSIAPLLFQLTLVLLVVLLYSLPFSIEL